MTFAIVLAGGIGSRMHTNDIPKQFLLVGGKPIIVYTLEKFEASLDVDKVIIVCKEGYKEQVRNYIDTFRINKVIDIVDGGETRQASLYQGVLQVSKHSKDPANDIVLIHDAVRPTVSLDLISQTVKAAKIHGACISVGRPIETILMVGEDGFVEEVKNRKFCRTGKAPHAYRLSLLASVFKKSVLEGKVDYIDDESMMFDYGVPLFTVLCSDANIKITNRMDYVVFRSFISTKEDEQFEDENI